MQNINTWTTHRKQPQFVHIAGVKGSYNWPTERPISDPICVTQLGHDKTRAYYTCGRGAEGAVQRNTVGEVNGDKNSAVSKKSQSGSRGFGVPNCVRKNHRPHYYTRRPATEKPRVSYSHRSREQQLRDACRESQKRIGPPERFDVAFSFCVRNKGVSSSAKVTNSAVINRTSFQVTADRLFQPMDSIPHGPATAPVPPRTHAADPRRGLYNAIHSGE